MSVPKRPIRLMTFLGSVTMLLLAQVATGHAALSIRGDTGSPVQVGFDPVKDETQVLGRIEPGLCFALSLPQEWRLLASRGVQYVLADPDGAEIEAVIRSADEVRDRPGPDLARRDAALLQQDQENLLGRPAQAVTLASLSSGAMRWTATWVDANLPSGTHALTLDTFIVPLSGDWLLEISLSGIPSHASYEKLATKILASLRPERSETCKGRSP